MREIRQGRYVARLARGPGDVARAQALRAEAFLGNAGGCDADAHDAACLHLLVEEARGGRLVCCFRVLLLEDGAGIARSYSAQFYELSALAAFEGRMAEMGRFCIRPGLTDPDILRVAWAAMTRLVDEHGVAMLFGCSSFKGVETAPYLDSFAVLGARHLAPRRWWPRVKAPAVFRFAERLKRYKPDLKEAMRHMPPLLRTYLMMGGWVSDHAVIDRQMDTLHVFTGVEIGAIPAARARLLRALAG
ncbi:GNAT family N-acetyltransferase [Roseovarius nitratireducens]|uniref:GNAT family N-acetyltransferase n=1 Tax=Roseovarius nitratireducens TaxID=2044597 RepID=UPI000CE22174|nr:GNAT family N-acetyltransferase [Roseovarius nitratireducens]